MTTNDSKNRNPSLVCEGTVKVAFEMEPATINFAQIERTAEAQHKIFKITRGEGGPLAPELLPIKHENVKASLLEIEKGEAYELDVELAPPWPNRAISTYLTIKTGVEQVPEEKLRVYARIAARLRAAPTRFTVPRNLESEMDLKARLMWSGDNPGKILEVTSSDPKTSAGFEEKNGQQFIVLHVPKGYVPVPRSRTFVMVKTDDKAAPELKINVNAARPPRSKEASRPSATPTGKKPTIRRINPLGKTKKPNAEPAKKPAKPTNKLDEPTKGSDKPAKEPPE